MYCGKCGAEAEEGNDFCINCGNKITQAKVKNNENLPNDKPKEGNPAEKPATRYYKNFSKPVGVLWFVESGLWALVVILQIFSFVFGEEISPFTIAWNIFFIILGVKFGLDLLKFKDPKRAFQFAALSLLYYGYQFILGNYTLIIFILINMAMLVLYVMMTSKPEKEARNIVIIALIYAIYIVAILYGYNEIQKDLLYSYY